MNAEWCGVASVWGADVDYLQKVANSSTYDKKLLMSS